MSRAEYLVQCELFVALLSKKYLNTGVSLKITDQVSDKIGNLARIYIKFDGLTVALTIMPEYKWPDVMNYADKRMNYLKNTSHANKCEGCFTEVNKLFSCNGCAISLCGECHIIQTRKGRGLVSCRRCGRKTGELLDNDKLNQRILNIRSLLN